MISVAPVEIPHVVDQSVRGTAVVGLDVEGNLEPVGFGGV